MSKKKFTEEERVLFSLAQEKSRNNDLEGTVEVLEKLIRLSPKSALFNATLASTYKLLNDYERSERFFSIAVQLSPTSEIISLGLFHCLWEQNKRVEAIKEMERYTTTAESEDYRNIKKELKENGLVNE